MRSKGLHKQASAQEAYVWIWLPGEMAPVIAGRLETVGGVTSFLYGQSYLQRTNAIAIYDKELPLKTKLIEPLPGLHIAGSIRDAAPDAWGRRVIINRIFGKELLGEAEDPLNEISYLLESGSDRIGALDFQTSATTYVPREYKNATLEELLTSAERVEKGIPLTEELDQAIHHGSSIGGARPKALISDGQNKFIAKFSTSSDTYDVVKTEFVAMRLAALAGIRVAPVHLKKASGKDVLLIERFDRIKKENGYARVSLISALTLLELNEMAARHGSYQDLAEIIRTRFEKPKLALRELFRRLVFNILIGNNDDHARNHAALWDGKTLTLSPAYDLCPQKRSGRDSNQAMYIFNTDKTSRLEPCLQASNNFLLNHDEATQIIEETIKNIFANFEDVCDEGNVSEIDRSLMKRTQFVTDFAFEGLTGKAQSLALLLKHR